MWGQSQQHQLTKTHWPTTTAVWILRPPCCTILTQLCSGEPSNARVFGQRANGGDFKAWEKWHTRAALACKMAAPLSPGFKAVLSTWRLAIGPPPSPNVLWVSCSLWRKQARGEPCTLLGKRAQIAHLGPPLICKLHARRGWVKFLLLNTLPAIKFFQEPRHPSN